MAQRTILTSAGAINAGKPIRVYNVTVINTTAVLSTTQMRDGGVGGTNVATVKSSGAATGDSATQDFGRNGLLINDAYFAFGAGAPSVAVVYDLVG